MTASRRGSLHAATWLIGLGVLFLVREAADLSWGQAWPLFVVLVGVASLVSTVAGPRRSGAWWRLAWPLAWITVGIVLLLSTTGRLGAAPGELIAEYWPWLLIAAGVWFLVGAVLPRRHDVAPTDRGEGSSGDA